MSLYKLSVEFLDLRSFSNLWYWIAVFAVWAKAIGWGLGVPYDMVRKARREGGQALYELEVMARITTGRMLATSRGLGPWLVAMVSFGVTSLALLGFVYHSGLAEAVFACSRRCAAWGTCLCALPCGWKRAKGKESRC